MTEPQSRDSYPTSLPEGSDIPQRSGEPYPTYLAYSTSTVKHEVVKLKLALKVDSREALVEQALRLSLIS